MLGGTGGLVRLGTADSTLLGPERTIMSGFGPRLLFQNYPGMASDRIPAAFGGVGVVWMGLWVGCWLRIAQWTRASCFLWLSCEGRTVDALAPGADEGRGRPR